MVRYKETIVEELFDNISPFYDLLNDILSFGIHRLWRRKALKLLNPKSGQVYVDICCGTGDMAILLSKKVQPNGKVIGIDYAKKTLLIASKKAIKKNILNIEWLYLNALNTGLKSQYFDGGSIAYGLRNVDNPAIALNELFRILKPNGRVVILDFYRFKEKTIGEKFQSIYLRNFVIPIASIFGLKSEYEYIENSLKSFPSGDQQMKLALNIGFSKAEYIPLTFNQMGILFLIK
tara:strand:- start:282 stop:983 length:702 start_codon:yes stop_codon:yes gene_type:complete